MEKNKRKCRKIMIYVYIGLRTNASQGSRMQILFHKLKLHEERL